MKKISMLALCAALAAGFGVSPVLAQSASSSTTTMAKPAHTAKSIECSKEADAKGLHGKARKKFRSACKHDKMAPAAGGSTDKD
ncbi:MAG: PsiF family protein [Pseudomonadota bacterium]